MLKDVWNAKISLCWWHLRRAVRTRLAIAKLATTPYDPGRANAEFSFIDVVFVPFGQADGTEYEGGVPNNITPVVPASQQPQTLTVANGLCITIPARQPLTSAPPNAPLLATGSENQSTVREPHSLQERLAPSPIDNHTTVARGKCTTPSTTMSGEKENIPLAAASVMGGVQTRAWRTTKPPIQADAADAASLARVLNAHSTGTAARKAAKGRDATAATEDTASSSNEDEGEGEEKKTRRTFCLAPLKRRNINARHLGLILRFPMTSIYTTGSN
jgi:hypothetical protein